MFSYFHSHCKDFEAMYMYIPMTFDPCRTQTSLTPNDAEPVRSATTDQLRRTRMAGFRMIRLAPLLVLLLCHLQGTTESLHGRCVLGSLRSTCFLVLIIGLCTASTNGFLTQSEVETAAENNEGIPTQDRLQLLFPSINFTESQNITALSFVATGNPANETLQIQVWRPGLIENSFVRIAAVGNNSLVQGSGPLYRYVLPIPIPVSPGDVLGIHIPWFPGLFLRFRDVGVGNTSTYYFQAANLPQQFITSTAYSSGSQLIPLVAVQFGT